MRRSIALLWACAALCGAPAFAQLPMIDTHSHINVPGAGAGKANVRPADLRASFRMAAQRMDDFGFHQAVVMPPPQPPRGNNYDIEELRASAEDPKRFLFGGGGGTLNAMLHSVAPSEVNDEVRRRFRARAEEIVSNGAVVFGEIAIHHVSLVPMGPNHPYEWVAADHPLLLLLADIAAEKDKPIDLHIDLVPQDMPRPNRPVFNPATPETLKANLEAFERLPRHNPRARIVWAHAGSDPIGTRTPQIQRELLARHANLFMSLRVGNAAPAPFFALDPGGRLKPAWLQLLREFPDRFVLGSDFFHAATAGTARGPQEETLEHYRRLVGQLTGELAAAVAHRNAQRIYNLSPL